jgi:hypothetical protein
MQLRTSLCALAPSASCGGACAASTQKTSAAPLHVRQGFAGERANCSEGFGRSPFDHLGSDDVANAAKASRSGFTRPFGKLGKPINGLTLPAEVEDSLRKRATHAGVSFLEMLRERLVIAEMGRDAVEDAHRRRLDAIEGKQQE